MNPAELIACSIAVMLCIAVPGIGAAGETLYNGIVLPAQWPPQLKRNFREPMPVPYLESPPAVIPIDVGRQLLVDDFLVESTTLRRTFHRAEYHPSSPVLKPDQPWEAAGKANVAYPYSGGVWYDPADKHFKIWYCAASGKSAPTPWLSYATSADGIQWEKPALSEARPQTNIVLDGCLFDSATVWLDHETKDLKERFKYFTTELRGGWHLVMRTSPDGIHWTEPVASQLAAGDRTTVFYNPFRKVWVVSERTRLGVRGRAYTEDPDPRVAVTKSAQARVDWCTGEDLDPRHPNPQYSGIAPQLYNLDATPYESLMLGFSTIWQGPENKEVAKLGIQKHNDVLLGFSRDGFHWHRPWRERFIACTEKDGTWNYGNVQSAGGGCLVVGDKLYFYVSGRAKDPTGVHGNGSTGLAVLRRDGFASMDAGNEGGTLTTRPVTFKGRHLFVNLDAPQGELRTEVLDREGKAIEPFTLEGCGPVAADKTLVRVTWKGAEDLSALGGKPVRFRFHLRNGSLYAFWVSPEKSGASYGYVAAGGPGFIGPTDTVGAAAAGQ